MSQMKTLDLIDSFSEFKEFKNIDRETLMHILEEVFRAALAKRYGTEDNFDIIVNIDKGDLTSRWARSCRSPSICPISAAARFWPSVRTW